MRAWRHIIVMFLISVLFIGGLLPGIAYPQIQKSNEKHQTYQNLALKNEKQILEPPNLEIGDLVFFDSMSPPGRWNVTGFDHVALYIGENRYLGSMRNIEKQVAEINITNFTYFYIVLHLTNPTFARVVSATPEQKQGAIDWGLSRIGDRYQTWDPQKMANPNSGYSTAQKWYCSEFIWAAFYNNGIDVDRNGWDRDFPWFFPIWSAVSCDDIYYDNDLVHFS
jgi:hypothetical protein